MRDIGVNVYYADFHKDRCEQDQYDTDRIYVAFSLFGREYLVHSNTKFRLN